MEAESVPVFWREIFRVFVCAVFVHVLGSKPKISAFSVRVYWQDVSASLVAHIPFFARRQTPPQILFELLLAASNFVSVGNDGEHGDFSGW